MVVSITGIVINAIVIIAIIVLVIVGLMFNNSLQTCETQQSPFCYTIHCPCDENNGTFEPPCFGFAKRPAEKEGQWYCSNAPLTAVNSDGSIP